MTDQSTMTKSQIAAIDYTKQYDNEDYALVYSCFLDGAERALKELDEAKAEIERLRLALTQIRDYVDGDPANAHPADCALMARQALREEGEG